MQGQKSTIADILQYKLPDDGERQEFRTWVEEVGTEDFFKLLPTFFGEGEIKAALAEYAIERFGEIEIFTGCRIDAVVTVEGSEFGYRSYNEVAHI